MKLGMSTDTHYLIIAYFFAPDVGLHYVSQADLELTRMATNPLPSSCFNLLVTETIVCATISGLLAYLRVAMLSMEPSQNW